MMEKTQAIIRPYTVDQDAIVVFELWQKTIGQGWPLTAMHFQRVLSGPNTQHFVAKVDGQVVGFLASLKWREYQMGRV